MATATDWADAGYVEAEAEAWLRAGVRTPAQAFDYRLRGFGPAEAAILVSILSDEIVEWTVVGAALEWPTCVPRGTDADAFVSFEPGAVFAAARAVWRARGGGPERVDPLLVLGRLQRSCPEISPGMWQKAIRHALDQAIQIRDEHLPIISRLRRAPAG